MFSGYLDKAFKDKNLNKLEVDILWRLNTCKWGYAKNQASIISWTGSTKSSVSRAVKKLISSEYIRKTDRGFEPIESCETGKKVAETGNKKGCETGREVAQSGKNNSCETGKKVVETGNNVPSLQPKFPLSQPKVADRQQRTIYTKHNKNIIESIAKKTAHTLDVKSFENKELNQDSEEEVFQETTPEIERDNRFMLAGQRPLKKYPDIWLTKSEFEQVKKAIIEARVDGKKVFSKVNNKIINYKANGRSIEQIGFCSWLTGWALNEVINETASLVRLDRARGVI